MSSTWKNLPDLLRGCASHRADVALVADEQRALTGRSLLAATLGAARVLATDGVRPGQKVVLDTRSAAWTDLAIAYCGITWLGAVPILVQAGATMTLAAELAGPGPVVRPGEDLTSRAISSGGGGAATADPPAAVSASLDIVFTSGTTGSPKPVSSSHADWMIAARPEMLLSSGRRTVVHAGIPFAVSGGVHGIFLSHLLRGVTSVEAPEPVAVAAIADHWQPIELHLTPFGARAVQSALPRDPDAAGWTSGVRVIRLVGAAAPDAVREGLLSGFPRARCVSVYALTEGGAACCVDVGGGAAGRIGRPAEGTEIRVADSSGLPVKAGESGEILIRGQVAGPRYTDQQLDREWHLDGWTRTGDIGVVTGDGSVSLVGRAREMIMLGSGRLSPEAVEAILRRRVGDSIGFAGVGLETQGRSDDIAVLIDGMATDPAARELARRLSELKGPFRPAIVDFGPIPRTELGKVRRRDVLLRLLAKQHRPG
ncbi:class I adenylate-forming enzyme family protein [Kribbella sp. NPDC050820]|uniref:class I adenylate-forming enzyme family protein n=1 Tax=Kribbella sp. NPDC050820 TaxID=3155408 RepID=UPI0033D5BCAF